MALNTKYQTSDKPELGGNKEFADKLRGLAVDRTAGDVDDLGLPQNVGQEPKHKGAEPIGHQDGGANLGGYFR